jgi:Glyoxalase-like domain
MPLDWEQVIVDSSDPEALGWWVSALGWVIVNDDPEEFEIRPAPDQIPGLLFVRVPEGNSSEVRAARRVDVGQAPIAVLYVAPSYKGER